MGGGFDPKLYKTLRLWAKTADDTLVPISIVYRRDALKRDGSNPVPSLTTAFCFEGGVHTGGRDAAAVARGSGCLTSVWWVWWGWGL